MRPLESLFIIALLAYSFVIWYHRLRGAFHPWMVWLFGAGLACDVCGTVFLCVLAAARWSFTLHTTLGLAALLIMALHFAWALHTVARGNDRSRARFDRFSVWAWCVWLVAFLSGIPRS